MSVIIQEAISSKENTPLRTQIIDPIIEVLEQPAKRNKYISYGNAFLDANAEMLSKEFPTKRVTFPRRYVDEVLGLFGFTVDSLRDILTDLLKSLREEGNFKTLLASPTNVVHAVALFYSDMIFHRVLRDSARQQLGLSVYAVIFDKYYRNALPNTSVMTYTYLHLDNSWGIVKSENVVTWIGNTVETSYGFWKTRLSVDMNLDVLTQFLSRVRTSFNQNMKMLTDQYHRNLDNGNLIGEDIDGSEDYIETKSFKNVRNNLIRFIRGGDPVYKKNGDLYASIAKLKVVKQDQLYEFAQRVDYKDITTIIDDIFYVFIVKENNKIEDINSYKYIGRITNLPTAIDRAITGMPIILPMTNKYQVDSSLVKAYICLIATYVMLKINDATK